MPRRPNTDFAALFESLVADLRVEVAASVDRTLADFSRRLARLEKRLDRLDPAGAARESPSPPRLCSLCERPAMARGLCSPHYQQWRYRERKNKNAQPPNEVATTLVLPPPDVADDN